MTDCLSEDRGSIPRITAKTCKSCKETKDKILFPRKSKRADCYRPVCLECYSRIRTKAYKQSEIAISKQREKNKKRKIQFTEKLLTYLMEHPCVDCGETDVLKLEFDHIKDNKQFNISTRSLYAWNTVLKEIAKCEVRCGGCHLKITAIRTNSTRVQISKQLGLFR